jgi:hypothetical protein
MNDEFERSGRKSGCGLIEVISWNMPGWTEKIYKNLSLDSWFPGRDSF